ncbi:hypothetical protein [Streptomyces sp. NPDC060022]|uniref:hypothetical protein n=1 Tax=Streptomyces sp. NPDC060022 TaxID=3347039 RepID=UPI00369F993E
MTSEEFVYAATVNLFGSDIQPPEIEELLHHLHELHQPALPVTHPLTSVRQQPTAGEGLPDGAPPESAWDRFR